MKFKSNVFSITGLEELSLAGDEAAASKSLD